MTGQVARTMGARDWPPLVLLAACFCGTFLLNDVALGDLSPLTIVFGRVALGAAVLHLVIRFRGERVPTGPDHRRDYLVMGALSNALPFTLTVAGQTRISGGLAAILIATTPLCTIVVAHLLTHDERLSPNRLAGVLVGFAGAVVVIGPTSLLGLRGDLGTLAGQAAVLGAAACYGLAAVYGRRLRTLPPLTAAAGQLAGATPWMLPVAVVVDRPWTREVPGSDALGAIAGLALICTALAYVLSFRILAKLGPTNFSLVTFLIPGGSPAARRHPARRANRAAPTRRHGHHLPWAVDHRWAPARRRRLASRTPVRARSLNGLTGLKD
jgi:drug/metabolite transporter (DMT)-like permease